MNPYGKLTENVTFSTGVAGLATLLAPKLTSVTWDAFDGEQAVVVMFGAAVVQGFVTVLRAWLGSEDPTSLDPEVEKGTDDDWTDSSEVGRTG